MPDPRFAVDGTRLPVSVCPQCRTPLDAATGLIPDTRPAVGDLSLCCYCGQISVFTQGFLLDALSSDDLRRLRLPRETQAALACGVLAVMERLTVHLLWYRLLYQRSEGKP